MIRNVDAHMVVKCKIMGVDFRRVFGSRNTVGFQDNGQSNKNVLSTWMRIAVQAHILLLFILFGLIITGLIAFRAMISDTL